MKLFKKLAAAALAAVLALTMVGCGSSASLKDELLKLAMDRMTVAGSTATHSKELDALAAKLVQEADKVAGQDAYKGDDAKTILTAEDVVKAAGIDTNANGYILNAAPNVQFKSSGMSIWSSSRWSGCRMPSTRGLTMDPTEPRRSEQSRWATMLTLAWQWARSAARNTL